MDDEGTVRCPKCGALGNPLDVADGSHCGWAGDEIVAGDFRVEPEPLLGRLELCCPDPACRWSEVLDPGYHNLRWLNAMVDEHLRDRHATEETR